MLKTNWKNLSKYKYLKNIKTLYNIKHKLEDNAVVTKADKNSTVAILNQDEYKHKFYNFVDNVCTLTRDPTENYNRGINNCSNRCMHLFDTHVRYVLKPINACAQTLNGLSKIHKENMLICPVVNFATALGYKAAEKLLQILQSSTKIICNHSVKDSIKFVNKIKPLSMI